MPANIKLVAYVAASASGTFRRCARELKQRGVSCGRFAGSRQMLAAAAAACGGLPRVVVIEAADAPLKVGTLADEVKLVRAASRADVLVLGEGPTAEAMLTLMQAGAYEFHAAQAVQDDPAPFCDLVERICGEPLVTEKDLEGFLQTPQSNFVGRSPLILEAVARAAKVLSEDSVLFLGETGAGKSFLARAVLEACYEERAENFVRVDCGALAESLTESELCGWMPNSFTGAGEKERPGLFEVADGGVLFLDEIGNLALSQQKALLVMLESHPRDPFVKTVRKIGQKEVTVDVQVIAATQYDLAEMVRRGKFLEALFHRISRYCVRIPPLKARPEDILYIGRRLMLAASIRMKKHFCQISDQAAACLRAYPWPGNVRELGNVMEAAVRTRRGTVLDADDLPAGIRCAPSADGPQAVFGERILSLRTGLSGQELHRLGEEFLQGPVNTPAGHSVRYADVTPQDLEHPARLAPRIGVARSTLWKRIRDLRLP